jgi:hypothetical protein
MSVADPKCYVRLERPIPGVNHVTFIDQRELAAAHTLFDRIASRVGVEQMNDFYVYCGEHGNDPVRWHAAGSGLAAVRAVKAYAESHDAGALEVAPEYRESVLKVLEKLEQLLDQADTRDAQFCIVGNY